MNIARGNKPEAYLFNPNDAIITINGIPYNSLYAYEFKAIWNVSTHNKWIVAFGNFEMLLFLRNNNKICYGEGSVKEYNSPVELELGKPYVLKRTINGKTRTHTINGELIVSDSSDYTRNVPIYLFGHPSYNWVNFVGGIAYLKIWNNNNLILDLVPKEENGVCGMYDKVSGNFYGNNKLTIEYI